MKAPEGEDPDLYYAGSFTTFTVKLDQLKFIDLLGKWKPVELSNEDGFYVWGEEELPVTILKENYLKILLLVTIWNLLTKAESIELFPT